jgi:hypothetical protein
MDWLSLIAVLYVVFAAVSLVSEGWRVLKESSAVLLAFFLIIAVLIGYVVYAWATPLGLEEGEDAPNKETAAGGGDPAGGWWNDRDLLPAATRLAEPSAPAELTVAPDVDLVLVPGVAPKAPTSSSMNYEAFKALVTQQEFLQRFTDSIRTCLQLKQKKYVALRKQAQSDLKAYSKTSKGNPLSEMMDEARNHQLSETRDLIQRIEKLLKTIKTRLAECSVDDTTRRLTYALYKKDVGLESLQGRTEVKDMLARRLYTFSQNPKVFLDSFQNMALMAGPGAGKTRLATVIAHVYGCSGILVEGTPVITTKSALVSAYVNDTTHTTRSFLLSTLERVAFIDEAYDLVPPPSPLGDVGHRDHGHEAVTEIVNFLDKMQGLSVMIVGGYERDIRTRFLAANEGMPRRFPNQLVLTPYTLEELARILVRMLQDTNAELVWTDDMTNYVYTLMLRTPGAFPNQAGDCNNLSAEISHAIYNSVNEQWPEGWRARLLEGMNSYLAKNNMHLE